MKKKPKNDSLYQTRKNSNVGFIMQNSFVHLKVHSDFSLKDGLSKMPALVKKAQSDNMIALGISDFNNFYGLVRFYGSALSNGIKPIVGIDIKLLDETTGTLSDLTLIAKTNDGYKKITEMLSEAYSKGYDEFPKITKEHLIKLTDVIILISQNSLLGHALVKADNHVVKNEVAFFEQYFHNHFYIAISRIKRNLEEDFINAAITLSEQKNIPLVAVNDVCFLKKEDFEAHEIRVAIYNGDTLEDPNRKKEHSQEQYFKSQEQMIALFKDIPSAIENTVEIAKRCNVTLRLGEYFLPSFPTGDMAESDFLVQKSKEGLEERLEFLFPNEKERAEKRKVYDDRLIEELDVINQMGFPGYFLIVMEFIQWSKAHNIPVGPGRGSGAGSLVAYSLKITDLNPIPYDLLFERFLNPERVSMPDFDIDFCMIDRDKVIEHVSQMYGEQAVSQIITFGTLAARGVVRDVARVLGMPYSFGDRISKLIPPTPGMTLAKALDQEESFSQLCSDDPDVGNLVELCKKLEGVTRNVGKHAGGVVIAPNKITDFSPLYFDEEGKNPVTHFDKNDVEYAGLVKFDFLGLRTLTIIKWALEMINKRLQSEGKSQILIESIPLDDKSCYDYLCSGKSTAVFQLESQGMKNLIKRLKPDCFEDMIALVALFRPGPLESGMVDNFVKRKHGEEEVAYPDHTFQHLSLKPILEPTYGVVVYQEQVMQIAQILAGYSLGGADLLRRAMGKKKPEEMAKQREVFREGAVKQGVDADLAMQIFDLVEKFAGYGFNKSHSATYALLSYQTLWLKKYYPAEFMAAVMSSEIENTEKLAFLFEECLDMGLKVLPPDVNSGDYYFTVNEKGEIVYALGAIKGVGLAPVESILQARKDGGIFKDLFDLSTRTNIKKLNKRTFEALVKSGACDKLGPHRAALMVNLEDAMKASSQQLKNEELGLVDMFGLLGESSESVENAYASTPKWSKSDILKGEMDTLGIYLSGHPIESYQKELNYYINAQLSRLTENECYQTVTVAGMVDKFNQSTTKKGNSILNIRLEDRSGSLEISLFDNAIMEHIHKIEKGRILVITGKVMPKIFNQDENAPRAYRINVQSVQSLEDLRLIRAKALAICIDKKKLDQSLLNSINEIITPYVGSGLPLHFYYQNDKAAVLVKADQSFRVKPNEILIDNLKQLLGEDNVLIEFKY